jgi:hypothetical protein
MRKLFIFALLASSAAAADRPRVNVSNAGLEASISRAMLKAQDPACLTTLEHFGIVTTPANIEIKFQFLKFEVGSEKVCKGNTSAYTHRNGSTVWICVERFNRLHPLEADAAIIHELFHTVGLDENPPTSLEITKQVVARCQ